MSKFGERLKYLRKQSNVSQDDLAKRLGVSRLYGIKENL